MSVQGSFLPDGNVLITIVCPPPGETEQIKSVAYVIDVSGSMGANATVKEGGSEQATGQSVLQLVSNLSLYLINFSLFLRRLLSQQVCNSVAASISVLGPSDECTIVTFSSDSKLVIDRLKMTEENKLRTYSELSRMREGGNTNLWSGLECALKTLSKDGANPISAIFLLTDGQPNVEPPNSKGHGASLQDFFKKNDKIIVHTFGFSSAANTTILEDISNCGGGLYSAIYSADMVATNFINAAAKFSSATIPSPRFWTLPENDSIYTLTEGEKNLAVCSNAPHIPYLSASSKFSFVMKHLPGTDNQDKAITAESFTRFRVSFAGKSSNAIEVIECNARIIEEAKVSDFRDQLIKGINEMARLGMMKKFDTALEIVRNLSEKMRTCAEESSYLKKSLDGFIQDLEVRLLKL